MCGDGWGQKWDRKEHLAHGCHPAGRVIAEKLVDGISACQRD
jgi:hypothetical protein